MVFVESMLKEIPPVTRFLCGSSLLIHFLIYIDVISQYDVFFNIGLIFSKYQVWRLFTNLFYFGEENIFVFFQMMMLYRCSKRLEEHTFRNKTADYLYFLIVGIVLMIGYGSFAGFPTHSRSFLTMLLYLWSRYNQNVVLLVFGFVPMKAPYITWFFVLFDILVGKSIAADILGIVLGHAFYFFHDIYPKLPLSNGKQFLKTPALFEKMVNLMNLKPNEAAFFDDNYIM